MLLARHEVAGGFERLVVVKRILAHLSDDAAFIGLFLREARLSAMLSHPNIVSVIDLFQEQANWNLVLEFVHGMSARLLLKRVVERKTTVPVEVAVSIVAQMLRGLHHAHTAMTPSGQPLSIVHRDVSPENILLSFTGIAKLSDFGVARAISNAAPLTADGVVRGKINYLAPELLRSLPFDGRADVFSAGVVLYELLANHTPFAHLVDPVARLVAPFPAIPRLPAQVPAAVVDSVLRSIESNPTQRYETADAFADALEAWLGQRALSAQTVLMNYLREAFAQEAKTTPYQQVQRVEGTRPIEFLPATPVEVQPATETHPQGVPQRKRWLGRLLLLSVVLAAGAGVLVLRHSASKKALPMPAETQERAPSVEFLDPPTLAAASPLPSEPQAKPVLPQAKPVLPQAKPVLPQALPVEQTAPAARVVSEGLARAATPGTLLVLAHPWAEVSVDGKKIGTTPLEPFALSVGRHRLTLSNPELGASRTTTVSIVSRKQVTLKVDLERQR